MGRKICGGDYGEMSLSVLHRSFHFFRTNECLFNNKCYVSSVEQGNCPYSCPHHWAFGLGKHEACQSGVCPGSHCVLCHSSNGPGPGRQHGGVQDRSM